MKYGVFQFSTDYAIRIDDLARDNRLETDAKLREGSMLRLRVRKDMVEPDADDTPAGDDKGGPAKPKTKKGHAT